MNEENLRSFVAQRGIKDLDTLSYLTGIETNILKALNDKRVTLSDVHRDAVLNVVPDVPDSLLRPKHASFPSEVVTRRGDVPPKTRFIQIPAQELVVGDMLLMAHRPSVAGSHWASVLSIREQGRNLLIQIANEIDIAVDKSNLVKVARTQND
jgi:hypothetical protein